MFSDIETKLKAVAKAMAAFGVIAAIAGAVFMYIASGNDAYAAYLGICALMLAGGFALFFGSFFAYGLGQLIENTQGGTAAAPSAPQAAVTASVPCSAKAAPAASDDEATTVAIATAAIAASRGASACAFKVLSVTKIG